MPRDAQHRVAGGGRPKILKPNGDDSNHHDVQQHIKPKTQGKCQTTSAKTGRRREQLSASLRSMAKKAQRPCGSRQAVVQGVDARATAATPQHATHRTQQPTRSEQTHTKLPGTRGPQAWTHTYNHGWHVTQSTWHTPGMLNEETRRILARYRRPQQTALTCNHAPAAADQPRFATAPTKRDFIRGTEHHQQLQKVSTLTDPATGRRSPHGPARHCLPGPAVGSAPGSAQGCWRIPSQGSAAGCGSDCATGPALGPPRHGAPGCATSGRRERRHPPGCRGHPTGCGGARPAGYDGVRPEGYGGHRLGCDAPPVGCAHSQTHPLRAGDVHQDGRPRQARPHHGPPPQVAGSQRGPHSRGAPAWATALGCAPAASRMGGCCGGHSHTLGSHGGERPSNARHTG